jgi:lipoprotein signal peptidase
VDILAFDPEFRRRTPTGAGRRPGAERARRAPGERPADPVAPRRIERQVPRAVAVERPRVVRPGILDVSMVVPPPAVPDTRTLARAFFPVAALVAVADLATKAMAEAWLVPNVVHEAGLPLQLVRNAASAGGVSLGDHTRVLNVIATGIVVGLLVMLVPTLARVDRKSTRALALVVGGGLGNLASLVGSPHGVVDFLMIPHAAGAWVINGADVAIAAGLLLLGRTVLAIVRAIRTHGGAHPVAAIR